MRTSRKTSTFEIYYSGGSVDHVTSIDTKKKHMLRRPKRAFFCHTDGRLFLQVLRSPLE